MFREHAFAVLAACALLACDLSKGADDGSGVDASPRGATPRSERSRVVMAARSETQKASSVAGSTVEDRSGRVDAAQEAFDRAFPKHGIAYHFLAQIHSEPNRSAMVIGYMRRGSRFRASERVPGVGCARGWHRVPGSGFVCRGEGYKVGDVPQSFEGSPIAPSLDDALPYYYAYALRDGLPQYWRVPTKSEEDVAERYVGRLRRERERRLAEESVEEDESEGQSAALPESNGASQDPDGAARTSDGAAPGVDENRIEAVEAPAPPGANTEPEEAENADVGPSYVRLEMRKGFYVSIDQEEKDAGRGFFRTVRGTYVRKERLVPNQPPVHRGVVLGSSWTLPIAFVYRRGVHRLRSDPATAKMVDRGVFEPHTPLVISAEVKRGPRRYWVARNGDIVRASAVRVARAIDRPSEIPAEARWVHVSLTDQTLVAYEGDRAAFATVVSTGQEGFETPTGTFRIQSKHISTTMDDLNSLADAYLIEDVPWTMYFEGNYALHGAFWHSSFGQPRSHGCINLAPADARFLFQWTQPILPASWHGVFADPKTPGTYVFITE